MESMTERPNIQLLYFDGCPGWWVALLNLRLAMEISGVDAAIELVRVVDEQDAMARNFHGSPSILLNGVDLWNGGGESWSFNCRLYPTPEGLRGTPTVEMLSEALR